jgi:hypothetical protein
MMMMMMMMMVMVVVEKVQYVQVVSACALSSVASLPPAPAWAEVLAFALVCVLAPRIVPPNHHVVVETVRPCASLC